MLLSIISVLESILSLIFAYLMKNLIIAKLQNCLHHLMGNTF